MRQRQNTASRTYLFLSPRDQPFVMLCWSTSTLVDGTDPPQPASHRTASTMLRNRHLSVISPQMSLTTRRLSQGAMMAVDQKRPTYGLLTKQMDARHWWLVTKISGSSSSPRSLEYLTKFVFQRHLKLGSLRPLCAILA